MAERDELLESKDETISILRDQLREEREARRRADTLLAQAMQFNSALNERLRELEAATDGPEARKGLEEPAESAAAEAAPGVRAGQASAGASAAFGESSLQRRLAENMAANFLSSAITTLGAWALAGLAGTAVAVVAFVFAAIAAIDERFYLAGAFFILGLIVALIFYYVGRRQIREANRKIQAADDAVWEAIDEEAMREAAARREAAHREALRRDDNEIPY